MMKISEISIRNFRSIKNLTLSLSDYTCLIGANGAGKSTVLQALNVFFREEGPNGLSVSELEQEDFHSGDTSEPVEIIVKFTDLSSEARAEFADYFRADELIVSAVAEYDATLNRAAVKQRGYRKGLPEFRRYFEAAKEKRSSDELKSIYDELKREFELPEAKSGPAREKALHDFEEGNPNRCTLIPSEDQFYGFSKGKDRLEKYIQWIYVPAVKEASSEQVETKTTAIGKLLQRTVRQKVDFSSRIKQMRDEAYASYQKILEEHQDTLDELSRSLNKRVQQWAHPDANLSLQWQFDAEKAVRIEPPAGRITAGESGFTGNLARLGHGLQRSILLAILQELASYNSGEGPTLLLGCEEPELYQHPSQARHLAEVLRSIAGSNAQVLVTSHSPYFVDAQLFEQIRVFRKKDRTSTSVFFASFDAVTNRLSACTGKSPDKPSGTLIKIHHSLNPVLNEMFFVNRLVLVESAEDRAYIHTYMHLLNLWDEFRKNGCAVVPVGKKSELLRPLIIAQTLSIPVFVVFDSDGYEKDEKRRKMHEQDNLALLRALGVSPDLCFPEKNHFGNHHTIWKDEIGSAVFDELGEIWRSCQSHADNKYGQAKGQRKYELNIAAALEKSWQDGHKCQALEVLCANIINFATSHQ